MMMKLRLLFVVMFVKDILALSTLLGNRKVTDISVLSPKMISPSAHNHDLHGIFSETRIDGISRLGGRGGRGESQRYGDHGGIRGRGGSRRRGGSHRRGGSRKHFASRWRWWA